MNDLNKKKLGLLSIISVLFLILLLSHNLIFNSESVQSYFQSATWMTIIGILVLYAVKSITMTIPNSVLYITAGALFPTWLAILITCVGLTISLSIGYFTGKKLGETNVYNLLAKQKRLKNFLNRDKEDLLLLCFIARLLALPFGLASFFFGALKLPFFKYVFVSLLGVTPTMLPIVFSGAAIANPLSLAFLVPFGISFVIMLVVVVVYKKKTNNAVAS